jgi:flagellin FlaB
MSQKQTCPGGGGGPATWVTHEPIGLCKRILTLSDEHPLAGLNQSAQHAGVQGTRLQTSTPNGADKPIIRRLKRSANDQRGITGLETAIIMISFVVVASVFAYTVLSAGMFSSEQGNQAIHAGVEQVQGAMQAVGGVILLDTGVPTGSTAADDQIDEVLFTVSTLLPGQTMNLTTTVDSDNDGDLSDETGASHTAIISYLDDNQVVDDIAWTITQVAKGNGDEFLDYGEKIRITVNVSPLATALVADVLFTLEMKPDRGSSVVIERMTPAGIDNVTYTN